MSYFIKFGRRIVNVKYIKDIELSKSSVVLKQHIGKHSPSGSTIDKEITWSFDKHEDAEKTFEKLKNVLNVRSIG